MEGGSTTLKVKLWWVGARERKKKDIFGTFYFVQRKFFGHLCFMSMYSALNTLSEYTYFYISKKKKITSYTFLLVFKICRIPINSLWITLYELSIDIPLKRAIFSGGWCNRTQRTPSLTPLHLLCSLFLRKWLTFFSF